MAQDIRKLVKEHKPKANSLSKGHKARFEAKLKSSFGSEKKNNNSWMKVAAMIAVILTVGFIGYRSLSDDAINTVADTTDNETTIDTPQFTLGDISPDLKKIEDYYMTGINVQLASLEINKDNKELIDGYMKRLSELDKEYQELNKELNEVGPTEETINALIDNLKMRLELLFKLKNKLNELKNKNNEDYNII